MNKALKTVSYFLLAAAVSCNVPYNQERTVETASNEAPAPPAPERKKKKIKLALILDTSNSMDGLIEQAKNQLWKIVNQLAKAKDVDGEDPEIELALYHYGNDNLSMINGYVELVSSFTTELDEISEKLFALQTRGGSEYCGTVIKMSLNELTWSQDTSDLQLIYIAGNEEFTQGFVNYEKACLEARSKNVVVNTIFCGNHQRGIDLNWKHGADLADGVYLNIDQDAQIVHIPSPYDDQIEVLNKQLNDTYLPYGKQGISKKEKQLREDANAESYGKANAASRYLSKGSKVYKNTTWDLVDASESKEFEVSKIEDKSLPEVMKGKSEEEKMAIINKYKAQRDGIKSQMNELNKKRESYVAKKKAENAGNNQQQLDDVIVSSIIKQAKEKSFKFDDEIN